MLEITPDLLLQAYRIGVFPMGERRDDPKLYWLDPRLRAVLPLDAEFASRVQVSLGGIIDVSPSSEALQDHAVCIGQQDHAAGRMQNILHRGQHFC